MRWGQRLDKPWQLAVVASITCATDSKERRPGPRRQPVERALVLLAESLRSGAQARSIPDAQQGGVMSDKKARLTARFVES